MKFFVRDGKRSTKQKALLIMVSIMALVAQPLYGLVASQVARAVTGTQVVTPVSMAGWTKTTNAGGAVNFVAGPDSVLGSSSLQLTTTTSNDSRASVTHTVNMPLGDIVNLSFKTKQVNSADIRNGNATMRINIDINGDGVLDDQLMFEPYYNGFNGTTQTSWQTWNVLSGKFWSNYENTYNGLGGVGAGSYASNFTVADVLADYPNAKAIGLVVSIGTWNPSQNILVDNIVLNDTAYDFERATIASCPEMTNIHSANLSGWDLSETRATGHNQITTSGLHIWTESNTSTDKAAAYYATNFALQDLGTNSITDTLLYTTNLGSIAPSTQLVIDFDGNGTTDGILVGESIYINNWWLSNGSAQFAKDGAPQMGGGNGSNWFGTAEQWLNAFPFARVKAIGYSLGSGVKGDYTITQITAGCVNYTFGVIAPTLTVTTPAEGQKVSTKLNGDKLRIEGVFKDDIKANYATMQLVRNGSSVAIGTLYGYGSVYNPAATYADVNGNYVFNLSVPTNLPDGEYSLFYTGTDFDGGITARMERKFFIDNTAPNTPNNLRLQVRSTGNFVGQNGWTNQSDVTALWNSNNTETVTYEYQYWNDVTTSSWKSDNRWKTNSTTELYAGTVNEGQGKHYYCVVAIDLAGNRSNCSATFSFNYDATPPNTDIVVSPVMNGKFTVSGSASDNLSLNRVYVQLVNHDTGLRYGGTTLSLIGKGQSSNWSVEYKISDLPQGNNYAAHVEVVDMSGNRGTAGWTNNFVVDKTGPTIQTVSYTVNDANATVAKSGDVVRLTVAASDPSGINKVTVLLHERANNGVRHLNEVTNLIDNGDGTWSLDTVIPAEYYKINQSPTSLDKIISEIPDGHKFTIAAYDNAGNVTWNEGTYLTIDNTPPIVTVKSIGFTTDTTPTIDGTTDENGKKVKIKIDDGDWIEVDSNADGNWSYTPAASLSVGSHKVVAVATDAAGNTSSSDTSAPQPYWTQFTVTITNPDDDQTSSNPDGDIDRGPVAAGASTNPPITNPNDGDGDNTTTNDTTTTDGSEDTDVLAESTTDNSDNEGQVLAAQDEKGNWSIVNLVLSAATILLSLVALIGLARRKEEGEDNHKLVRILTLIPVAIAATAFLLIEDLSASAIWFNWWTALYAVVLAVQIAIVSSLKNSREY